ncbi:MAG: SDR family NAD(P)-dependent oxidoreductase [Gemmatimonadaceae bacterium]
MRKPGDIALVTGAGHRLGREFALALGARGASVAVHYNVSGDEARTTVEKIVEAGGTAQLFQSDLTRPDGPHTLIDAVIRDIGPPTILVNSAAVMERTPFGEVSVDAWEKIFALNLRAPFFLAQAAARVMPPGSVIINISDLAAYETWPDYIPHSVSKAAILRMTESLARVLGPGIRVNSIAPGAVLVPEDWDAEKSARFADSTPLRTLGEPADAVGAMLYLLDAKFVTGETIVVDGGRRIRK